MFHGASAFRDNEWSSSSSDNIEDVSVTSSEIRRQRLLDEQAEALEQSGRLERGYPNENTLGGLTHARSMETISDQPSDAYVTAFQDRSLSLEETRDMIMSIKHKTSSSLHGFIKPQLVGDPAEIIVITTSMGGGGRRVFASARMAHLMNCKRVVWISIDMNKDVIFGRSLKNSELLEAWESQQILDLNSDGKILVPQCIIDGVCIGDEVDVAGLEEDGDLDYIINRERCPHCLGDRGMSECYSCGAVFKTLIPEDLAATGGVIYNLGFEEVPFDCKAEDFQPRGNPKINFTPLEDVTSSVTF